MRYDVYYDADTGEFLEKICKCEPEDGCEFKDNWIADGRPKIVPSQWRQDYLWKL